MDKAINKLARYLSAGNLYERWNLLNEDEKIYAYYLVHRYGYRVEMATQKVYLHGYDSMPYNYKKGHIVNEPRSREFFNL